MDRNEYRNCVLAVLDRFDLTEADYTILNHLHYCDRPRQDLVVHASGADYSLGTEMTRRQTSSALRRLFRRANLREVSPRDIRRIASDLRRADVLGPVYGMPNPGDVQFTVSGAKIWNTISAATDMHVPWLRQGFAYTDIVEQRTRWHFATQDAAEKKRRELACCKGVEEVTPIEEMDRLQIQPWWNLRSGWRFDCIEQFNWQGRCGGRQRPWVRWTRPEPVLDPPQVRRLLRLQDLNCAGWCVLLSLAEWGAGNANVLGPFATRMARQLFRTRNAAKRVTIAMRQLYGSRRIQFVDEHTQQPIPFEALGDPASGDRSRLRRHIDMTTDGAQLLRELGPAVYGKKWQSSWSVEREIYRKEHRYGKALNDISAALEEYDRLDAPVISIGPVTALGPWCLKWWERFDDGCRIEVEIGESPTALPQSTQGR